MDGCPRLEKVIGRSAVADDEVIFPFVLYCPGRTPPPYLIAVDVLRQQFTF